MNNKVLMGVVASAAAGFFAYRMYQRNKSYDMSHMAHKYADKAKHTFEDFVEYTEEKIDQLKDKAMHN